MEPDDAAAIQVVEAILVAVLVAGALIFFSLAQRPSLPADPTGREQSRAAADALALLQGEDPGAFSGTDELSHAVRESLLNGAVAAARQNINESVPPGSFWSLRVYNGFGSVEVLSSSRLALPPTQPVAASAYAVGPDVTVSSSSVRPWHAVPNLSLTASCTLSFQGQTSINGVPWRDLWRAWQTQNSVPANIVPDFAPFGGWSGCGSGGFTVGLWTSGTAPTPIYTVHLVVWDAF